MRRMDLLWALMREFLEGRRRLPAALGGIVHP